MASAAGGEEVRAIGARLRAAREKKALTILQAAERLHVDARLLEALEAQDFAALGADVYVRGHLRRYADSLGESAAELQELYAAGTRAAQPDLTRIPRRSAAPDSARFMLPVLLLVVGAALAGALWWVLNVPRAKSQPLAATPASVTAPAAETPAPPAAAPAGGAAAATAPRTTAAAPERSASPAAGETRLALAFSAASWVDVSDAGGRRLLQGLIDAGAARTLSGAAPLRVILGNARGVALQVDGRPVVLAGLVRRDGSARLLIDETGRAALAPPRLAHGD
ncbi:MAG TPA: RodZ domain-containing protein [Steroidobacteraceae bacterium]|nr:RodZ domain-containing protein [Steroidobacteraceae bacterium]